MPFSLVVEDTFNRANSPTGLGATSSGSQWIAVSAGHGIIDNAAYRSVANAAGSNSISVIETGFTDVSISTKIQIASVGDTELGLCARVADPNNFIFLTAIRRNGTVNRLAVFSVLNSSHQLLGEASGINFLPGSSTNITLEVIGNSIRVLQDGLVALGPLIIPPAVMSTLGTVTRHGIRSSISDSGNSRWDDLQIYRFVPEVVEPEPEPVLDYRFPTYISKDGTLQGPVETRVIQTGLPRNVELPTISGIARVGQTLIATPGKWTAPLTAPSANVLSTNIQWVSLSVPFRGGRQSSFSGTLTPIAGANQASFSLTTAHLGLHLAVLVTAENMNGSMFMLSASRGPIEASNIRTGSDLYWAETRNVWEHPLHSSSIWYRPIGDDAVRLPANLQPANGLNEGEVLAHQVHISLRPHHPVKTLTVGRDPKSGNGDQVLVPANLFHDGSGKNPAAFQRAAQPLEVWQGYPLNLTMGGNPSWEFSMRDACPVHLKRDIDRARQGAHVGSAMSAIGGTIRPGELTDREIHHALKLVLNPQRFLSRTGTGYRWPAYKASANYSRPGTTDYYNGPNPALRMGALLALPANFNWQAISHPKVRKIARALTYYGAYVVDTVKEDVHGLCVSVYAVRSGDWPSKSIDPAFHSALQALLVQLQIIDNNEAWQITSGGGAPIAPKLFAPPFGEDIDPGTLEPDDPNLA